MYIFITVSLLYYIQRGNHDYFLRSTMPLDLRQVVHTRCISLMASSHGSGPRDVVVFNLGKLWLTNGYPMENGEIYGEYRVNNCIYN